MINSTNKRIFVVFLVALLLNKFFWFLPFVLIVPVIVTLVLSSPLMLLGTLAVLLELFSTSFLGVMTLVVLLPWLITGAVKRFYKEVEVDFLFSFYAIVGLIIFSQLMLLGLSHTMRLWITPAGLEVDLWQAVLAIPWLKAMIAVVASTLLAATVSIFIKFNAAR